MDKIKLFRKGKELWKISDYYPIPQLVKAMDSERESGNEISSNYVRELLDRVSDPVHRKLIDAYRGAEPLESMESKLRDIIGGVLDGAD